MKQGRRLSRRMLPAALMVVAMVVPGVGWGQQRSNGTDRAIAHIDQQFNAQSWDVSARSNFNGTQPSGYWRFTSTSSDPNVTATGEVTCLVVLDNVATVGGIVTGIKGGTFFFNAVLLFMSDSGKFGTGPDLFSNQFLVLPPGQMPNCATPAPFLQPVIDGEVIVQDALS
jgi:hypothetical protein